ncbi:MAG: biopolymer transporter ExbD [Kiritimatiellaeota bacterium]|nr:biopolymer transporter ExbD [Kiritimatiellota bacterium]
MARQTKETFMDNEVFVPINLGPMIDCVMLLLLYYINCSTIEVNRVSKDVVLPFAQQGLKEENTSGRFIVSMEWNEGLYEATYVANGVKMRDPREMTDFINRSKKLQGNPKDFRVVIRADRKIPYEFTQQAMAAVADADVANVLFSTVENKDTDNQ